MVKKCKFFLFSALFSAFSCIHNSIVKTKNINDGWEKNQELTFIFENEKEIGLESFTLLIYNDDHYTFRNLYLLTEITSPNLTIRYDTIEYAMAQLNGKWLGKGVGKIKKSVLLLPESISFSQKGRYIISVRHAMRKDTLFGITSVGISVKL